MVDDTAKMFLGADDATKSAIDKAAETTQLADRHVGTTIGGGITPPYPPEKLAAFQELNTTHQVAIGKKASREVGFGFEIVPHERAEDPSDSERDTLEEFWFGRDTKWRIGPQGTPSGTPTEVFELARQDWHGIGWLCIELLYGSDNTLQGLAHVPADETRVRKADTTTEQVTAGHGYVQEHEGQTVYYGEAGDRKPRDGDDQPTYVDQTDGDVYHDLGNVSEPANELIFIPNPSPLSKYYGIPDWVAAIQTMVADNEAQRFNREYFEWDSMGQYFVMVENGTLTDESRETVREMIQGLREKEGRRVATLEAEELTEEKFSDDAEPASIEIEQIQQHSDSDMAFHEFREFNEHKISQAHEIPPQMIGDMESANRSNSEEAIADFIKGYIQPKQNRFAGRLYRIIHQQLLDVGDWTLSFKTRGGKNEQKQAEITNTRAEAAKGSLTVNERRDELGYEPLTDADGNELPQGRLLVSQLQQGAGGGGGQPAPSPNVQRSITRARKTEREQRREKIEKALYGEGAVVEYDEDGHLGVVTAVMEEAFTVPEGDGEESEVEASSDSPTYVVARQTGGFGTFSASDLSEGSIPEDEQGDPEDLAEAKESLKTEKDGWNTLPPGWSRLTLLDAWSSMSASFDGCMREIGDREVCASMKDEVLGTTRWRGRF